MTVKSEKMKTFESGLTSQATMLGAVPGLIALLLIAMGLHYIDKFPGASHFPFLLMMSLLPMGFGVAIICTAVMTMQKNLGRKVTVTRDTITYEHGKDRFSVRWEMLAFSAPPAGKKTMRALSISDGTNFARIEEIFFPSFNELLKIVSAAKQKKMSAIEL